MFLMSMNLLMWFLVVLFLTLVMFNKLQSEELSPKGAERRTDIELLALEAVKNSSCLRQFAFGVK